MSPLSNRSAERIGGQLCCPPIRSADGLVAPGLGALEGHGRQDAEVPAVVLGQEAVAADGGLGVRQGQYAVVIGDGLVVVDVVIVVVDVAAVHQRVDVVGPKLDGGVEVGQGAGVVVLRHVGVGAVVV